jgi:hypothetical protein
MTRLLLCTATILALIGSAHAVELPDEMVNENWRACNTDNDDDEDRDIYWPNNAKGCLDVGSLIDLGPTGYGAPGMGNCEFDKIEKIRTNAYRVHANCKIHWSQGNEHGTWFRTENLELEIIDGQLVVTRLSEG